MMQFMELPGQWKTLCLTFLLLLNILQYRNLLLLWRHGSVIRHGVNIVLAVTVFACMPFLGECVHGKSNVFGKIPVFVLVLCWTALFVYIIYSLISERRRGRRLLTNASVKESLDTMSAGVCFFAENGLPVLSNTRMHKLAFLLAGRDLQTLEEWEEAFAHPKESANPLRNKEKILFRFEDGQVWEFSKKHGTDSLGKGYVQLTAADVTELSHIRAELEVHNTELEEMIGQIQRINVNIVDITRQQEILTAKMRVHNKLGSCLLAARQYLKQDLPEEKKENMLFLWKQNLRELQEEVGSVDETDACEEVIRIADSIGIQVQVQGELPKDQDLAYLIVVALRECVTNAKRHADATRLIVQISRQGEELLASFENDGTPPKEEIVEGGGLSSLRERIGKAAGSVTVQSFPVFRLEVQLPVGKKP